MATHRFRAPAKIITTQQAPHNTFSFFIYLLSLMDGILSTDYSHVIKLFSPIFLGWIGVVVSRRFKTPQRKL